MSKLSIIAVALAFASATPASYGSYAGIPSPSGNETVVSEQPEGDLTLYSRTCRGWQEVMGTPQPTIEEGNIVKIVEQADGTVWMTNFTSTFNTQSWIKATKEDGKIVINGPQLVYQEYDYDNWDGEDWDNIPTINFYATAVEIYEYENEYGEMMRTYRPTEDGVFSLDIKDGSLKESGDGSIILGIVGYNENDGYFWTGYGDNYVVMTIPQEKTVVVPETAVRHDNWAMYYFDRYGNETGKLVNVAIDGNEYYIQGIYPNIPEAWIKGTLDGDVVTFDNFQYMGPDFEWNYFIFAAGGQVTESDENEDEIEAVIDPEGFALTLEADGSFSALSNLLFVPSPATNPDNASFINYFEGISIRPQDPESFTNPMGPDQLYKSVFDGVASVEFNLPPLDMNGNLLSVENLYFSVYVNSKVFTFDPDVYYDLPTFGIYETTKEIPYNTGNEYDFYQEGPWHTVYIYGVNYDDIYNVGIQSIYYPEGKDVNPDNVIASDIIMAGSPDDPSGVGAVSGEKSVKAVSYTDMQGRIVSNPSKGIYIKVTEYTDGSRATSKVSLK